MEWVKSLLELSVSLRATDLVLFDTVIFDAVLFDPVLFDTPCPSVIRPLDLCRPRLV